MKYHFFLKPKSVEETVHVVQARERLMGIMVIRFRLRLNREQTHFGIRNQGHLFDTKIPPKTAYAHEGGMTCL